MYSFTNLIISQNPVIPISTQCSLWNAPQLKGIHIHGTTIDLTDEQVYQLMEQSGVTIGVGYSRGLQFEKYLKYHVPGSVKKYSHIVDCQICGQSMLWILYWLK